MKMLLTITLAAMLAGCHTITAPDCPDVVFPDSVTIIGRWDPEVVVIHDTLYRYETVIVDTLLPDIIIIRDTVRCDTVTVTDTAFITPLNDWPGMIVDFTYFHGDSLYRVWVQWGEGGPWHQYILNDTVR